MNSKIFLESEAKTRGELRISRANVAKARRASHLHQAAVDATSAPLKRIHVWDLPLRVFHWALVAAVTVAIVTGELGGSLMEIHGKAGLAIVGLVVFRLVWGLIGSSNARFINFAPTAAKLRTYLRGRWKGHGHNPLGALSVFALLALLAVQAGSGLFGNDDIAFTGPLYALVDEAIAGRLTGLHRQLANVLLALLVLHIVAILIYLRVKKDNLIKPMVTGWKDVRSGESSNKGSVAALLVALAAAAAAVWFASGASWHKDVPAAAPAATQQQSATSAW